MDLDLSTPKCIEKARNFNAGKKTVDTQSSRLKRRPQRKYYSSGVKEVYEDHGSSADSNLEGNLSLDSLRAQRKMTKKKQSKQPSLDRLKQGSGERLRSRSVSPASKMSHRRTQNHRHPVSGKGRPMQADNMLSEAPAPMLLGNSSPPKLGRTGSANRVMLSLQLAQQETESSKGAADHTSRDIRTDRQKAKNSSSAGTPAEAARGALKNSLREDIAHRRPPQSPLRTSSKSSKEELVSREKSLNLSQGTP